MKSPFRAAALILAALLAVLFVATTPVYHHLAKTYAEGCLGLWTSSIIENLHRNPLEILIAPHDYYPPIFRFIAALSYRLHVTKQAASAIFSLLVVLAAVVLALSPVPEKGSDERLGLSAFVVYLSWPLVIGFSKLFCSGSLFLVFMPLTFFFLAHYARSRNPIFLFLCGLFFGLGMMSKWTFFLPFVVPLFYYAVYQPLKDREGGRCLAGVLMLAAGSFAYAGWWYVLRLNVPHVFEVMTSQTTLAHRTYLERLGLHAYSVFLKTAGPVGMALLAYSAFHYAKARRWTPVVVWLLGGVGVPLLALAYQKNFELRFLTLHALPLTVFAALALKGPAMSQAGKYRAQLLIALLAVAQSLIVVFGSMGSKPARVETTTTPFRDSFLLEYQGYEPEKVVNFIENAAEAGKVEIYECERRMPPVYMIAVSLLYDSPSHKVSFHEAITRDDFDRIKTNPPKAILIPSDCWAARAEAFKRAAEERRFFISSMDSEIRPIDWPDLDEFYDHVESNYTRAKCIRVHPSEEFEFYVFVKREAP